MKKKTILLIVIILIVLIWAPWMTNDWCKSRLVNRKFDSLDPINERWEVEVGWIPFGRHLKVSKPESERPELPATGGYGLEVFMIFTGNT